MMTDPTLPAAVPLRLPPRSAYAAPSSKSSKSTQRLESSLTYYPIRPFVPLHVCMKDLTADIFHSTKAVSAATRCASLRPLMKPIWRSASANSCSVSRSVRDASSANRPARV